MTIVFPRDAFNAANLYKCIGKMYLLQLEKPEQFWWQIGDEDGTDTFDDLPIVGIDNTSGNMICPSIFLCNKKTGDCYKLCVPCNSRESWPMVAIGDDGQEFSFDELIDEDTCYECRMPAYPCECSSFCTIFCCDEHSSSHKVFGGSFLQPPEYETISNRCNQENDQ